MPAITMPTIGPFRRRGLRFSDFRDTTDDARRSTTDLGLPNIDWSKLDPSRFDFSKVDFSKLDLPARAELAKQIRKASKDQFRRASKELNKNLPGRRRSPLPFTLLGAIGGLLAGWILATSPAARSAVERAFAGIRQSINQAIAGMTARSEETDLADWTEQARTPVVSDTYAAAIGAQREPAAREATVGVGPGRPDDTTT
jgi:hypothetical protein